MPASVPTERDVLRRPERDDRGFALGLALLALVVVSGVVIWAVFLGLFSLRAGLATVSLAQAFSAAEEGARRHVVEADWRALMELSSGASAPFSGSARVGTGWYRGNVTRLGATSFLVEAEGFDARSMSRQRLGVLVGLRPIERRIRAALDVTGGVEVRDRSRIQGADNALTGFRCPPLLPMLPALRIPAEDQTRVATADCSDAPCLEGAPPLSVGTNEESESVERLVNLQQFATTILMGGTYRIGPETVGGECRTGTVSNWGDPREPEGSCGNHVPFVFSHGDLTVTGGRGQALLVVLGDLRLAGDADISGLVLVRGRAVVQDEAGLLGALVVENPTQNPTLIAGQARIAYSSCAVNRALMAVSVPAVLRERGWIQLD